MRRGLKLVSSLFLGVIALLALGLIVLSLVNWNALRPWVGERVSEATGRSFAIRGDLGMSWQRPQQALSGWRGWLPWPHLRAQDVTLGNPPWATTGPAMASVQQVDFSINPLALLNKTISVSSLVLTEPQLALERAKGGANNWTFPRKDDQPSGWRVVLDDLVITRGDVRYVDPAQRADVRVRIDTLMPQEAGRARGSLRWKVEGDFNREKVSGGGMAGALLSLRSRDVKYPLKAQLKVGETEIQLDGVFTDPMQLSALDVKLKILGASMAQLFPLTGIFLPETPHFSTEGRVVGTVGREGTRLRYENFNGKVGSSDIGGTLEFRSEKPRPVLSGTVKSDLLDLKDLRALIGSDPEAVKAANKRNPGSAVPQPPDKVIPVSPFKTDRWRKIDVNVDFKARRIERPEALPLDNLSADIRLDDGVLALAPLDFSIAGGRLTTTLRIDGRQELVQGKLDASARGLKLKQMFPKVKEMQASAGQLSADAKLTANGNSLAALAGSATGEVKSLISEGSISKFVLEAIGLNIGSAVVAKLFGDRQVQLNCMASDLAVSDGVMQTRTFIVDTEDATIRINGKVNLDEETLDLRIHPDSKGVRLISLRSPLYVSGSFKNPDIGIDKGVAAAKAGAAVAIGTVAAPIAGLLALINPGPEEEGNPCARLLKQAAQPPSAPPPAKAGK